MKKDMLISVIVPVYNTEKYLRECLESIIAQTYKMIEIILVDDGSTDASSKICDEYAKKDERVKVIHQDNRGLVYARKVGVSQAAGKYITFVDSDDWIANETYQELINEIEEYDVDIISYGYSMVTNENETKILNILDEGVYKGEDLDILYPKMMYDENTRMSGITRSLCTKLIKREFLEEKIMGLDERITFGEDAAVVYDCCLSANSIFIKNSTPYFYRIHDDSMCRNSDIDVFSRIDIFQTYMANIFKRYDEKYGLFKQLKLYVYDFIKQGLADNFQMTFSQLWDIPKLMDCKVVLYGAGKFGERYYEQLKNDNNITLVAWVDKNKFGQVVNGYIIEEPAKICKCVYDKILIAVKDKDVVQKITKELVDIGVKSQNIVWQEPRQRNGQWLVM